MGGRYEVEDLLKLRASPLVVKPPGLPPKEEWMGPADPRPRAATTKNKIDDAFNQVEGFQKRPTLLDSARRSTTDPERIHLGPPRNSFASSNAARTRSGAHERTKTNEDTDQKFTDRRSGAFGGMNGKFGARVDDEYNGTDRVRRRDDPDGDGRSKREYDRPRWNNRDSLLEDERADDGGQRNGREGYSRSKFDQPWTRKEKPVEVEDDSPAWRRGQRDRDFDRNDAEPEWVDSIEASEPAKAHTHEDFLQWMEKMKNKSTGDDKPAQPESTQKEVATLGSEKPPPRVVSDSSASMDKFFAKFEKDKLAEGNALGSKPTKSRFASIFGSKDEPKQDVQHPITSTAPPSAPVELEQPTPAAEPAKTANDAAFAKLLEMLNKNQTVSPPGPLQPQSTRSPSNIAELASTRSPDLGAAPPIHQQSTRTPVNSHTPNLSVDRLMESRSPAHYTQNEQTNQPKAGPQDLLDLLRRSNLQERQPPQQQSGYLPQQTQRLPPPPPPPPPPGLSHLPSHDTERQNPHLLNSRRDNPRSIFDDPAFSGFRNDPEFQQRASQPKDHGVLGGLFGAMNSRNYVSNSQQDQRPPAQAPPNLPPGLQRPPGLDHGQRPPPGWLSSNQQQRPQTQHPSNTGSQQALYSQPAYSHQQQTARQMQQRKPTTEMPLPPGFANLPPGFGPAPTYASPTSPDSAMQFAMRGGYGINERERMERERQQNAFAAMYGNGNGNRGGNGGVQLPPGFR